MVSQSPQDQDVSRSTEVSAAAGDARPSVAIIANSLTPYRLHLHRRIVSELPGVKLWSAFTHEKSSGADWKFTPPPEINPVSFGRGESSTQQDRLRHALGEWQKGKRVIRWLREQRVRAVVCCGYNDLGRLRIMRWCRRRGIPCMLCGDSNIRGDRAQGIRRFFKKLVVPWVLRQNAAILPCGELGVEYFARYGGDANKMFLFPYEPDYGLIQRLDRNVIVAARARFGLGLDRRRIIFSGRLVAVKRCDLVIDAFAAIADQRPDWDLVIAGDGPLKVELQNRVPERLRSRITWTGFLGDQRDVGALYRSSDVLVLPSDYEPWAVVINEAAAAGLAIVCTDVVGAAAELVRDGVNGRLFPPGDLDRLVAALCDVTDAARVDGLKAHSRHVLDDWRRRGDPVEGLRRALISVGVRP